MRKGLISFTVILCTLIPFITGCQSSSAETAPPTLSQNQSIQPEVFITNTKDKNSQLKPDSVDEPNEETSDSTDPSETSLYIQETEPGAMQTPNEPPRETRSPVIEQAEPVQDVSAQPSPAKATPSVIETKPIGPQATEPQETQKTEPAVTEPPVTEPALTEPPATKSAEVIDLNELLQYGLKYAADIHGYEIYPGVRDGYYPAYTCVFKTMEEGKAAIRGCVDDTTRALLAVPGTQIAVEINGLMCRARIDIVIVHKGHNRYQVNVYYG